MHVWELDCFVIYSMINSLKLKIANRLQMTPPFWSYTFAERIYYFEHIMIVNYLASRKCKVYIYVNLEHQGTM